MLLRPRTARVGTPTSQHDGRSMVLCERGLPLPPSWRHRKWGGFIPKNGVRRWPTQMREERGVRAPRGGGRDGEGRRKTREGGEERGGGTPGQQNGPREREEEENRQGDAPTTSEAKERAPNGAHQNTAAAKKAPDGAKRKGKTRAAQPLARGGGGRSPAQASSEATRAHRPTALRMSSAFPS